MILYLDTSSLAKLYIAESDSKKIAENVREASAVATSIIAFIEMKSALARRHREGTFTKKEWQILLQTFVKDWQHFVRVEVDEELIDQAGFLLEKHALKALDSIHLASALLLRTKEKNIRFLTSDERLGLAARREKLLE
ncbi:MAG: type II toxin-antitoxin system VapC family toxin [Chlamydiae bacterium]|nr:type II toxin-antitoxin system VapC family toxin [Chlamydiota bacterium]MBI3266458.1 type II toxin-antitoxin system VapC family toxin [Chlamydiota bacterium]